MIKEILAQKIRLRVNHRGYLSFWSLLIWCILTFGNLTITYGTDFVSEEDKTEKGAVCELDEQEFSVLGDNHAVMHVHKVFTVYNQNGTKYGKVHLPFSKFVKTDSIEAELKTIEGKSLRRLKKKDIQEASLFSQYQFYTDDQEKYFDLTATTFPYVLEYNYKIEYRSLFFWEDWFPQMEIPVRHSVYILTLPKDFGFKMYKRNLQIEPLVKQKGGTKWITFELHELPSFKEEQIMPPERDCCISVAFAPDRFKIENYPGSTESWNAFGKWYYSLAHKQYVLSPSNQTLFRDLVKDFNRDKDKVKVLYQYFQRKMRYVAIKLGISGWQPREAESVARTCYGDCKDLSTLFIAMLKINSIKAYPALIRTQDEGTVLADFPSNQFNHVIAFVPLEKETLWLDCTCSYCSFGELPWVDEGCNALVVLGDSAELIQTPRSSAEENRSERKIQAKLEPDGTIEITGIISAKGNNESNLRGMCDFLSADQKKEWLSRAIGSYAPNHTLLSYDFNRICEKDSIGSIGFKAKLIKYLMQTGNELLINLNLIERVDADEIPKEKERKYPVDCKFAYVQDDEVSLEIPPELKIKSLPPTQDFAFSFGSFKTSLSLKGNQLTYKRVLTIAQKTIEIKDYSDYQGFLNKIYNADRAFVVLEKIQ